jgi:hypothetical protein
MCESARSRAPEKYNLLQGSETLGRRKESCSSSFQRKKGKGKGELEKRKHFPRRKRKEEEGKEEEENKEGKGGLAQVVERLLSVHQVGRSMLPISNHFFFV